MERLSGSVRLVQLLENEPYDGARSRAPNTFSRGSVFSAVAPITRSKP